MKKIKPFLIILILLALVLSELYFLFREQPKAEQIFPVRGVITADPSCNMRQDPNTQRESIRELRKDVFVTVLGPVEGEMVGDSTVWYEIQYGNLYGYVSEHFVRLDNQVPAAPGLSAEFPGESEFLQDLQNQGFPADYQEKLLALYRKHPSWTFKALHTNYSFDTAVRGQNRPGVNMVTATAPPEYKSKAEHDFNYESNTWHEYEPGWVGASEALIAYQMDPRNFLDEIQIFQFENQQFNENMEYREGLSQILAPSFMAGQEPVSYINTDGLKEQLGSPYLELLIQAGVDSGVSPYHLTSRILQEVGPQGSHSVSGEYSDMVGYYNYYNIGAFGGSDPVYMGLVSARDGLAGYSEAQLQAMMFPWTDPYRAIAGGAIFIGQDYINVDQHSLYLQKFNLVSRYSTPFTHQYMANVLAPEYEAIDVYKAYEQMGALDSGQEFVIPVFADMPLSSPSPTGGGSPNNWLASIKVNGKDIPKFAPTRYEYELQISSATKGIAVEASTWAPDASLTGTGVYHLKPGRNEIILQVMAPSGAVRNYRLSVVQGELTADKDPYALPKIHSDLYQMDALGYLYGLDPLQNLNSRERLLSAFALPDGYHTDLVNKAGESKQGNAATGDALRLLAGTEVVNEFPLVVLGDANGDGSIDVVDLNELFAVITLTANSKGTAYDKAMDANQDSKIDVMDLNMIFQQISGGVAIPQRLID